MALPPPEPALFPRPDNSPFEHACERCGTYAPLSSKYGPSLCAECIERTAHPIVQTSASLGEVLTGVFQLLRVVGLPAVLLVTLAELPMSIFEFVVPDVPFALSNLWGFFVGTAAEMVVLHLAWQVIAKREQHVTVGAAVSVVGQRLGALLGTRFFSNLLTLLYSLLLVVPGVMKALSLTLAMPIALHEGADANAAMAASTTRMKGHRWTALFAYCLAAAPFVVLVLALMCLAMGHDLANAASAPAASTETTAVYDYTMLALGILTPAALVPVTLVPAVLYAKLRQPQGGSAVTP